MKISHTHLLLLSIISSFSLYAQRVIHAPTTYFTVVQQDPTRYQVAITLHLINPSSVDQTVTVKATNGTTSNVYGIDSTTTQRTLITNQVIKPGEAWVWADSSGCCKTPLTGVTPLPKYFEITVQEDSGFMTGNVAVQFIVKYVGQYEAFTLPINGGRPF